MTDFTSQPRTPDGWDQTPRSLPPELQARPDVQPGRVPLTPGHIHIVASEIEALLGPKMPMIEMVELPVPEILNFDPPTLPAV